MVVRGGHRTTRSRAIIRLNLRFEDRRWGFFVLLSWKIDEPSTFEESHLRRTPTIFGVLCVRSSVPKIGPNIERKTGGRQRRLPRKKVVLRRRAVLRSCGSEERRPLILRFSGSEKRRTPPSSTFSAEIMKNPLFVVLSTPLCDQSSQGFLGFSEISIFSSIFHFQDRSEDRDRPSTRPSCECFCESRFTIYMEYTANHFGGAQSLINDSSWTIPIPCYLHS